MRRRFGFSNVWDVLQIKILQTENSVCNIFYSPNTFLIIGSMVSAICQNPKSFG